MGTKFWGRIFDEKKRESVSKPETHNFFYALRMKKILFSRYYRNAKDIVEALNAGKLGLDPRTGGKILFLKLNAPIFQEIIFSNIEFIIRQNENILVYFLK